MIREKKALSATIITLMVAIMLATSISMVNATPPTPVSGKWQFTAPPPPIYSDVKKAGANAFVTQYNMGAYFEGPIIGTFEQYIDITYHFGDPETVKNLPANPAQWGSFMSDVAFNWKIERSFTGTVDGKSGTFTMHLEAKGTTPVVLGSVEGTWVIISGTGELANLHGQGTWWSLGSRTLGYEGQIHFDP